MALRIGLAVLAGAWLAALPGLAADGIELGYDLRPGDHLIYSQDWTQEVRGSELDRAVRVAWESHVLVVEGTGSQWTLGFQPNRVRAELLRPSSFPLLVPRE